MCTQRHAEHVEIADPSASARCSRTRAAVVGIGGDYLGTDVNIAARLAEKAGPGEIFLTEAILAGLDPSEVTVRRKKSFGLRKAKGIPEELAVYSVIVLDRRSR